MGIRTFFLFPALLLVAQAEAIDLSQQDLSVSGYTDAGRFQLADSSVNGEIISRTGAKLGLDKQVDENWFVFADLHWFFWRNQATDIALFHIAGIKFDADMQGKIAYRTDRHRFGFGLFDFKYNPDSRNLGEYLLRSEAYPTILENSQGKDLLKHSYSRVAGLEYGLTLGLFRQTGLLYAEQFNVPVNDISAAYFADLGNRSAELGFGVAYHRFLKMSYKIKDDLVTQELREYIEKEGLETKAVKLSLRGRLDFASMLGMEEGFKAYGEAALLGLKSDSIYYKHVMQRVPVMMGLEIPTFRILNSLSIEAEYFKNPYFGRKYAIKDANGSNFSPLPFIDDYQEANLPSYTRDDWKWSIFAHKALNPWVDLKVRFASDHLRLRNWDGDFEGGEPFTGRTKDWYFLARIEYHN